jgi:hypothetical protein
MLFTFLSILRKPNNDLTFLYKEKGKEGGRGESKVMITTLFIDIS